MSSQPLVTDPAPARRPLKTRQREWPRKLANRLVRLGLRPNEVSVLSIFFAILTAIGFFVSRRVEPPIASACLVAAAAAIQLRLLCNLLDGLMAIEGGLKSTTGDIYNDFPDRISDSLTLIAAGYAIPATSWLGSAGPALGWAASLMAALTAYVRLLGGAIGAKQYFMGPMAKQQRMGLLTFATLLAAVEQWFTTTPFALSLALVIIIVGAVITLLRRLNRIVADLNSK
jgi:phosphatidylglycerophosphate synthase